MDWKHLSTGMMDVALFNLAGTPVTVATVVVFVLIVAATVISSLLVQRALVQALRLRGIADAGTVEVARRLLHYLLMALGLAVALQTIGINLAALFAAGAVFAIGLGFAMQNIAQNFVSGVILLVERTIKPGDVIQVEGRLVRVTRLGIRATIARTLDEEEIIIPNSNLVQSSVTNYTLRDSLYRLRCTVGVTYDSDMKLVRRTLEETARQVSWRVADVDPVVLMSEFGGSSVDWEVSVWIEDPWGARRAKSQLNEAIWWAFQERQIVIAFPQLDVHFDAPLDAALTRMAGAA